MSNRFPPLAAQQPYHVMSPRTVVVAARRYPSLLSAEVLCLAALGLFLALA